jgi:hypothetical protein
VLVRLSDTVALSAAEVNDALKQGATWTSYRSPGVNVTLAELKRLAARGLARETDRGWLLTDAGNAEWNRLETLFDNSNGYGDYGF